MGLTNIFTEPHKSVRSVFIILSFFFIAKFFVFLFDSIDGTEDGKISVGTCPNIPVADRILQFSLNLINLDCDLEGGLSYQEVLSLIGENYTIEDALKNRIFRTSVPFIDYFGDNPEKINDYFVGLSAEKVYQLNDKEFIFSVWNDKTYFIKGYLGTLLGGGIHPIYELYFVRNKDTGNTEILIFDREGWSETINKSIDLNGIDPTDVIVYKFKPKYGGNLATFTHKHGLIEDLKTYGLKEEKILSEDFSYTSFNPEEVGITDPIIEHYNLTASANGKLDNVIKDEEEGYNLALEQIEEIFNREKLTKEFLKYYLEDYESYIKQKSKEGANYIFYKLKIKDTNTDKLIYPAYVKAFVSTAIVYNYTNGDIGIINQRVNYEIGSFYPLYNGFFDGEYFYIPIPLEKAKYYTYQALMEVPQDKKNLADEVKTIAISIQLEIYTLDKLGSNKEKVMAGIVFMEDGSGFRVVDNSAQFSFMDKEELLDIIKGKERIREKVKLYAICDNLNSFSLLSPLFNSAGNICNYIKEKVGADKGTYFMEAITYYADAKTQIYY